MTYNVNIQGARNSLIDIGKQYIASSSNLSRYYIYVFSNSINSSNICDFHVCSRARCANNIPNRNVYLVQRLKSNFSPQGEYRGPMKWEKKILFTHIFQNPNHSHKESTSSSVAIFYDARDVDSVILHHEPSIQEEIYQEISERKSSISKSGSSSRSNSVFYDDAKVKYMN